MNDARPVMPAMPVLRDQNDEAAKQQDGYLSRHLDDAEFGDCLARSPGPRATVHLELCEPCRFETERALGQLANARVASRQWSEARAGRIRVGARLRRPGYAVRVAFAGLVVAIAAPCGVYLATHMEHREREQAQAREVQTRAREIARDNELLLAVNQELDESVAPAMQPLLLSTASGQQGGQAERGKGAGQAGQE